MTPSPLTKAENDKLVNGNIRYIDTAEAYDLWSSVYDTDGNFLQALDTIEMQTLLPRAISLLSSEPQPDKAQSPMNTGLKAVDLGCGTGRNTLQLLPYQAITTIVGLELSPKMLEIAQQRCTTALQGLQQPTPSVKAPKLSFYQFDMMRASPPELTNNADLIISTLVLEHIPLATFFAVVARILRPGGLLVMTNMHSEMGQISQAGFVDAKTGDKIRPTSYAHTVGDAIGAAKEAGLELVASVKETAVDEELAKELGARGRKWIGVRVWFGGIWKRDYR